MPSLYIITGSNGSGKSTLGPRYLPGHIRDNYPVFDGDLVFLKKQRELFPLVNRSPKEAKKLAFEYLIDTFEQLTAHTLANNVTFVYEGHFTNDAAWDTPLKFKAAGYEIHLIFFGLTDPDLSQYRVTGRVAKGGHYVDRLSIEENFSGNLEMLNRNFRLIDHLTIVDTSGTEHITLAMLNSGKVAFAVPAAELPEWFTVYLTGIMEELL